MNLFGFLLEGCTNGFCAGGCVAGTYVDFFCGAGVCAVVIYAVGYVTAYAVITSAGFAGLFRRFHVHIRIPFYIKKIN